MSTRTLESGQRHPFLFQRGAYRSPHCLNAGTKVSYCSSDCDGNPAGNQRIFNRSGTRLITQEQYETVHDQTPLKAILAGVVWNAIAKQNSGLRIAKQKK
jgi:hypothetical protein